MEGYGKKTQRGFISFLVLAILATTLLIGGRHLLHVNVQQRMIHREALGMQAIYLAQGAIAWATRSLEADPTWRGGQWAWGQGENWVKVTVTEEAAELIASSEKGDVKQSLTARLVKDEDGWRLTEIR